MGKFKRTKSTVKIGMAPGSLVHVGEQKTDRVTIEVIDYNLDHFSQAFYDKVEDCKPFRNTDTVTWINVIGLHDIDVISDFGGLFDLHPLLLEDVLNTGQRPKIEDFGDCVFLSFKMLELKKDKTSTLLSEQVSLVFGRDWVISFQEEEGDVFDAIRTRLREGKGIIRGRGADYLFYRLMDIVVDNYFFITEDNSETIEFLDEKVVTDPTNRTLHSIQSLKRRLLNLRKSVFPLREAIAQLRKDPNPLFQKETLPYLRDVYEHITQVSDTIETQKEIMNGVMDLYLSGVSNKMNQVMQVLTVISTIFIPLTFIAGIYGMNFDNIPELHYQYGYHITWGVMLVTILGMLYFFKRKKWL